jgi:hypothetical protein
MEIVCSRKGCSQPSSQRTPRGSPGGRRPLAITGGGSVDKEVRSTYRGSVPAGLDSAAVIQNTDPVWEYILCIPCIRKPSFPNSARPNRYSDECTLAASSCRFKYPMLEDGTSYAIEKASRFYPHVASRSRRFLGARPASPQASRKGINSFAVSLGLSSARKWPAGSALPRTLEAYSCHTFGTS